MTMLALFGQFYVRAYLSRGKKAKSGDKKGAAPASGKKIE